MKHLIILFSILLLAGCNSEVNNLDEELQPPKREFTKNIERVFSNEFEQNLISSAESFYPPRDSVLNAAESWFRDLIPDTNYWFYDSFDGIRIPYAITIDAINYYSDFIDTLNAGLKSIIYKAVFKYKAEITYYTSYTFEGVDPLTEIPLPIISFEDVYVVEMNLSWDHYCGMECGLYIKHKRIVVLNSQGELLQIFYDGKIPVAVS
jgi:hypothetical protein